LRILHAIHDFLPRHRAGSEIYAFDLCRALGVDHDVTVLCAEYDPFRPDGRVAWRSHEGVTVVEIVNNWRFTSFEDTYRPPLLKERIAHVLHAVQPDVVHVHNLLNLSFELPAIARSCGIPVVATLHDYTLVCPSGGQRIHRAEEHVCEVIDTERCARCFPQSPLAAQISFGRLPGGGGVPAFLGRAARGVRRRFPALAGPMHRVARLAPRLPVTTEDSDLRLIAARRVFDDIDLFVAPSRSIASEFQRLGVAPTKIKTSDYGLVPMRRSPRTSSGGPLRIGYVGTIVWHKGVHVLVEAVRGLPPGGYELRIFGDPDTFPEYSAALRERAAGCPVRFEGPFDRQGAAGAYAQIDVLVVPSLWLENSPLVIHEAFMAGVPVVGARIGGIADLISEGRTGLLYDPTSPVDLGNALRTLMDDRGRLEQLSDHARTDPIVKSIAEDARDWSATYADLVGRRVDQNT
jgi:glycosyltransferase involved in cell wall biosynthesis